jgi:hypothetical protein
VFADLTYLVQTFDAAYQELAGAAAPKPAPKSQPKVAPITSKAAAAEILGAEFFKQPQVRQAAKDEDPATRKAAMADMASVLHQYEGKLESGEARPVPKPPEDIFAASGSEDIFAAAPAASLHDYDPSKSFESHSLSDAGVFAETADAGAFEDPKPFEAQPDEPVVDTVHSLDALIVMLGNSSLMSSQREEIVKQHAGTEWPVEFTIDRVENTWGFDLPEAMKDGKTVEGHAGDRKLALRFPKARNDEIGRLRHGESLKARGRLAAWDDLFKKATLDVA